MKVEKNNLFLMMLTEQRFTDLDVKSALQNKLYQLTITLRDANK